MPPRVVKKAVRKKPVQESDAAAPSELTAGNEQVMSKEEEKKAGLLRKTVASKKGMGKVEEVEAELIEDPVKEDLEAELIEEAVKEDLKEERIEEVGTEGSSEEEVYEEEVGKEILEVSDDDEEVNEGGSDDDGESMEMRDGEKGKEKVDEEEEEYEEEVEEAMEEDEEFEEEEETMEEEFEKEGEDNAMKEEEEEGTEAIVAVTNPKPFLHLNPKETEVFIGKLGKEVTEDDIIKVFNSFGEIKSVRVMRHPLTQKSKGFAFLKFLDQDSAKNAIHLFKNGTEIKGKKVSVSASEQNNTLFVGNICKTWTKDQVKDALNKLGVEEIDHIELPEKSKGFCYIEFNTHSDAKSAFHILSKPNSILGCNKSTRVSFTFPEISEEEMLKVKTVYLEPVLEYWDGNKLKEICEEYGEIEKVEIHRRGNKNKDFALIEFVLRENALKCVEGLCKDQIDAGGNKKVFARLAKPNKQSQFPKYGIRGGFKVSKLNSNKKEKELENKEKEVEIVEINHHSSRAKNRRIQQKLRVKNPLSAQKLIKKGGNNNHNINIRKKGVSNIPPKHSNLNLNKKRQFDQNNKGNNNSSSSKKPFKAKKGNKFSKSHNNQPPFNTRYNNNSNDNVSGSLNYAYGPPAYSVRYEPIIPTTHYEPHVRYEPIRNHEPNYPNQYQPTSYDPTRYDLITRYGATRYEPVLHEPVRHEPVRHEPVRLDPVRYEPVRYEPSRYEASGYAYVSGNQMNQVYNTANVYEPRSGGTTAPSYAGYERNAVYPPEPAQIPQTGYLSYPSLHQQPNGNPSYPSIGAVNPSSYPNSSGPDYSAPRRTYY